MNYRFVLTSLISLLVLMPVASYADSITLDGTTPEVDDNITPPDNQKAGEENFYTFWLKGQIGTEYTANFSVSEEPAFTFVSGGDMNLTDNIYFNEETNIFSVTYTAVPLQQIDSQSGLELEDNQTLTIIAVSFPVAEGENGPKADMVGSWLATNFQEWQLTTPTESNNAMGATVSGDAGDTGDFEMYIPESAMNLMAEYDGSENYSADDLAVYKDDDQTSKDIETVTGGAYVNFSTTLPEESTNETQSVQGSDGSVSQSLTVAPVPAITLSSNKAKVEKLDYVKLTGRIKSKLKGKRVTLWRRYKNTEFEKFGAVSTDKNGVFTYRVKIRKNTMFKAKYSGKASAAVSVQVK